MKTLSLLSVLSVLGSISLAQANDARATRCEIFVDKISIETWQDNSNSNLGTNVYVKINPRMLNGKVRKVVFYHESERTHAYGGSKDHEFISEEMNRISDDYYQVFMLLRVKNAEIAKYGHAEYHTGAFYVETDRGTRYWANPGRLPGNNSQNFNFSESLIGQLWNIRAGTALKDIPKTAIFDGPGAYLNPGRCQ